MAKVTVTKNMVGIEWLALIQLVLAYEWLNAGVEKFKDSSFMDGIEKTLNVFASSKNPHHTYTNYLHDSVIPHAQTFGQMVRFGEVAGGLVLLAGVYLLWRTKMSPLMKALLAVTCFALAFLNLNFYLATGYTGPSAAGENTVLGLIEVILGVFYLKQIAQR